MSTTQPLAREAAPTGKLRLSINLGNPVLARRTADGAEGVSVELGREFARRLGVSIELVLVASAPESVELVRSREADVGFFAVDPKRSQGIAFTAPYLLIEGAYVVKEQSRLSRNEDVDRAGTRVVVGGGSAYDLYLTRELTQACIERAPTSPAVVDHFLARGADVAAGVKQQLEADAARLGSLRLLPGRFMVIQQAVGVPDDRKKTWAALCAFIEEVKSTGFLVRALERHRVHGASVAPTAH